MPIQKRMTALPPLSGGVNDSFDNMSLAKDQASVILNCHIDKQGLTISRGGSRLLNTTALDGPVTSIYDYHRPDGSGSTQHTLVTAGSYLYKYTWATGTFTAIANLNSTARPTWATFQNSSDTSFAFMANGTDFYKYDGTTVSNVASTYPWLTAPRYIMVYEDRMLAAGCDSDPYKIFICTALDGTNWWPGAGSTAVYWTVKGETGDKVTGLGQVYNFAVFFQRRTVTIITEADSDSTSAQQIQVASRYGTTSHWSIQTIGNVLYFADESHAYKGVLREAVENGLLVSTIEDNVANHWAEIKDSDDIVSIYNTVTEEILWGTKTNISPTKNTAFVYNKLLSDARQLEIWSGWWRNTGFEPHTFGEVLDSDSKPQIWRGTSTGYVLAMEEFGQFKDETYSSGTVENNIPVEIHPAPLIPGGMSMSKRFRKVIFRLFQKPDSAITIRWVVDNAYSLPSTVITLTLAHVQPYWRESVDTAMTQGWGTTVWNERAVLPYPVSINAGCKFIEFIIRSEGTSVKDQIAYSGLEAWYQLHRALKTA